MSCPNLDTLRRLHLGVLSAAWVLSLAACGGSGVTNGTASINSNGSGEDGSGGSGTATLLWTPVTQNTDDAVLTDLAGYQVFYGPSPDAMNTIVLVADPTATTYIVANLSPGTWYFTVSAYTSSGAQGLLSNIGTKTIE
jgi:hypothetical protein